MGEIGFLESSSPSIVGVLRPPVSEWVNTGDFWGPRPRTRNNPSLRHHHCDDERPDKRGAK